MSGNPGSSWRGLAVAAAVIAAAGIGVYVAVRAWRVNQAGLDVQSGPGRGKNIDYDLEALRRVDPKLILYDEAVAAAFETGFEAARGIAIGLKGEVLVAGDGAVRVFDAGGRRTGEFATSGPPRNLAADADGTLYVGLKDRIEVLGADGQRRATWEGLGERAILTSLAVTKTDVFAADAGNRVVLRYDKSGRLLGEIGRKDPARNIPGFVVPSPYFDLSMGADGLLRAVNPGKHRVEAYTAAGDLETWWGGPSSARIEGFAGCCNPVNIAVRPDGGFITCEKGLTRVKAYDAAGTFEGVVAAPEAFARHDRILEGKADADHDLIALDVAVDARGRVWVLDGCTGEVRLFIRRPASSQPETQP